MSETSVATDRRLVLLQQVFGAATSEASAAMRRWSRGEITLSLDQLREMPLEQVSRDFELGTDLTTMVVLTLQGEAGGTMILTFDEENGARLVESLTGQPCQTTEGWSELAESALCETGNILGCAYLNAITRLVGVDLIPSPPIFLQDFGACVLEQALTQQVDVVRDVMICETRFSRDGQDLNWSVLFIPNRQLCDRLDANQ
ncbi:MAG: chemotaxis protein [Pirellulaceae bacterium]